MSSASTPSPVIDVSHLTKVYKLGETDVLALCDVSLRVHPGEFVAIMGPSGSGKSTFMNILGCLDRPTSGEYRLMNRPVSHMTADQLADVRNRSIGFVFQAFHLLGRTTALQNVELPLLYYGMEKGERESRAQKALYAVGLEARTNHYPSQLSGGQQQRVAIARALVNRRSLLLADEPTGNLDSRTSTEIMGILQALNEQGLTIVLVTHEPDIAMYATRVVTFHDGRILQDEPVLSRRFANENQKASASDEVSSLEEGQKRTVAEAHPRRRGSYITNHSNHPSLPASQGSLTTESSPSRDSAPRIPEQKVKRSHISGAIFNSALEAVWTNRLRSLLTSLGMVFGVAAVIAAVALTQGVGVLINGRLSLLGANVLTVYPGVAVSGGVSNVIGSKPTLSIDDARSLKQISSITEVSPVLTVLPAQAIHEEQNWNTRVQGVFPDFQTIQNWQLSEGSWFSQEDNNAGLPVAVIGSTVASNLFSTSKTDPVGQTLRINNQNFHVIGVLQAKGSQSTFNPDDVIYAPLQTVLIRLRNTPYVDYIQVQVDTPANVNAVQQDITALLVERHHIHEGQPSDFLISNANQLLQTSQQFSQALTLLLVGIAAISLTVGGIGIMNIMLVSVTERIREIGIRLAIGARRSDIRNQFLIEALTLSVTGGCIGIVLGLVGGGLLIRWLSSAISLQLSLILDPLSILIAFGISATVGVAFGLYPAIRAARLDPITALHQN